MASLNRILVDKFSIEDAITFEILEENKLNESFLKNHIIKMEEIFSNLPKITLSQRKQELFLNGVKLTFEKADGIYNIYSVKGEYIGLGIINKELLKRDILN